MGYVMEFTKLGIAVYAIFWEIDVQKRKESILGPKFFGMVIIK